MTCQQPSNLLLPEPCANAVLAGLFVYMLDALFLVGSLDDSMRLAKLTWHSGHQ